MTTTLLHKPIPTATIEKKALREIVGRRVARFALEEAGTYFIIDGYRNLQHDFIAAESLASLDESAPRSDQYHAVVRQQGERIIFPFVSTPFSSGNYHSTDKRLPLAVHCELMRHGMDVQVPQPILRRTLATLPIDANPQKYANADGQRRSTFPLRDVEWASIEAAIEWTDDNEHFLQFVRSPLDYTASLNVSGRAHRESNKCSPRLETRKVNASRNYTGSINWNPDGKPFITAAGNTNARFAEYMRDTVPQLTRFTSPTLNFMMPRSVQLPVPEELYSR